MKTQAPSLDMKKLDAKLRAWRKKHNTPAKVAAAHRKVLLERVVQSMAFENEPVSLARLKALLKTLKTENTRLAPPATSRPQKELRYSHG